MTCYRPQQKVALLRNKPGTSECGLESYTLLLLQSKLAFSKGKFAKTVIKYKTGNVPFYCQHSYVNK